MKKTLSAAASVVLALNAFGFEFPRGSYAADQVEQAAQKASEKPELVAYIITFKDSAIS